MTWLSLWFLATPFLGLVLGTAFFAAAMVVAHSWSDDMKEDA